MRLCDVEPGQVVMVKQASRDPEEPFGGWILNEVGAVGLVDYVQGHGFSIRVVGDPMRGVGWFRARDLELLEDAP